MAAPETPSSVTKRPRLMYTYSNSGEQETVRVEKHFVEAWNTEFPCLVYEGDKMFCTSIK